MLTTQGGQEEAHAHACKIMVWNVQGADNSKFLRVLKEHIRLRRPSIVALVETHISGARAQAICDKVGFEGYFWVEAQGFQGGIWILWRLEDLDLNIIRSHEQYVTMKIKRIRHAMWMLTIVYGNSHV